jgi:8-oxo-dGTP diphosphatase
MPSPKQTSSSLSAMRSSDVLGLSRPSVRLVPVDDLLASPRRLAFDHHRILSDGVEWARAKLEYSTLGAAFCGDPFTINELRQVYESVWGAALDPRNFHRKVTGTRGFVEATGEKTARQGGRPAALYRIGDARLLHPAMLRPDGV